MPSMNTLASQRTEDRKFLAERGAYYGTQKDHTMDCVRTGWWLDNVYCGRDARAAVEAVRG
jgi:hypothetical protein